MAVSQAKQAAIEQRRNDVMRGVLRGKTHRQIAEELGVVHGTVQNDLKAVKEQWEAERTAEYGEAVAKELARVNEVWRTAWERFEASPDNGPAYMQQMRWCVEARIKLLGLEKKADDKPMGLRYVPKEKLYAEIAAELNRMQADNGNGSELR